MVMPLRFERRTYALEGRCSIQLSYGTNEINIAEGAQSSKLISKFQALAPEKLYIMRCVVSEERHREPLHRE